VRDRRVTQRVAEMRTLPAGIDRRSACRHPDWTGPDDLTIKITELRETTDWEKPIFVKIGSARPRYDVQLAVKAGADVVALDGMQGGTGATQEVFIEHAGVPTMPALRQAVEVLAELGMHREVQRVISGGIRSGAVVAKALAMRADAVSIGTAALVVLGCNRAIHVKDYAALGTEPGACHRCHTGRCPVGITTRDPVLESRLDVAEGTRRVRNFLTVLTMEA
jgi:methylamine---glutamate N-methyltransferase subunit C